LEPSRESNSSQISIPENPATALQNHGNQILANLPSVMGNVQIYQAKLMEIAQSNLQLTFEFTQRLLTLKSPAAFVGLVAEFTISGQTCSGSIRKRWLNWVRGSKDKARRAPEASAA
jgi:hypothetical protein